MGRCAAACLFPGSMSTCSRPRPTPPLVARLVRIEVRLVESDRGGRACRRTISGFRSPWKLSRTTSYSSESSGGGGRFPGSFGSRLASRSGVIGTPGGTSDRRMISGFISPLKLSWTTT